VQKKISFILNSELIETEINPAIVLLDFIRNYRLTGTKEGCKEGDCGACTVLVGELCEGEVKYKSVNSCLIPVQNISGKHIVTIEGLNLSGKNLNPVQQAFVNEGASQCGFCTPGFIVSLTGYFLNENNLRYNDVIDSLDGNICRCTGHNSIVRAAVNVSQKFKNNTESNHARLKFLTENKIIPEYFLSIKDRLREIIIEVEKFADENIESNYFVSGGTDLFVQRPDEIIKSNVKFLEGHGNLKSIAEKDGFCHVRSLTSVTDLLESEIMQKYFPDIYKFSELFGSTPIRNSATVGGNLNNASPIGDMTAFFMSLNANVVLAKGKASREIPLNKFYKSYKVTELKSGEFMESINFKIPAGNYHFNFEKVSKRTYLDIASVNSAVLIEMKNGFIKNINISAGGVAPIPMYLSLTSEFLKGKEISIQNIKDAIEISQVEISPISDARGSSDYKRLLLSRLVYTHFITLFPEIINIEETV
jgi:xanthine dehydrogenase small subunit